MNLSDRASVGAALALADGSAYGAGRLLAPRDRLAVPVPVRPEEYFSESGIRAGKGYERPRVALALGRSAIELASISMLVARRPWSAWPRMRERWWLFASAGILGVGVLAITLGPVLMDPLFNRFEPLAGGANAQRRVGPGHSRRCERWWGVLRRRQPPIRSLAPERYRLFP